MLLLLSLLKLGWIYYYCIIFILSTTWMVVDVSSFPISSSFITTTKSNTKVVMKISHAYSHQCDANKCSNVDMDMDTSISNMKHQSDSPSLQRQVDHRRAGNVRTTWPITTTTLISFIFFFSFGAIFGFPSISHATLDMEAFAAQQLISSPTTTVSTSSSNGNGNSSPNDNRIETMTTTSASTTTSTSTTMSPDEALCRFGQPGILKGDACVRAHMSIAPRTKNGVDAYGNLASRSTYVKCTKQYTLIDNSYYTSEWICQ